MESLDHQVHLEMMEIKGHQDHQEVEETLAQMENQAQKGHQVLLETW